MDRYSTEELKKAWIGLWDSNANAVWSDCNMELAKRLTKEEYERLSVDLQIQ